MPWWTILGSCRCSCRGSCRRHEHACRCSCIYTFLLTLPVSDGSSIIIIYCQHVCVNEINNINTVNTMDQQFWQIIALPLYISTTFLFHPFPYLAIACQSGDLFFAHHHMYKVANGWKKLVVCEAGCCNIRSTDETNGIQPQLNNNTTWPAGGKNIHRGAG